MLQTDQQVGASSASAVFKRQEKGDVIVIVGCSTYALFMDFSSEFYVTHVNGSYEGDTYMPPFSDRLSQTTLIASLEQGHKIFRYTRNK